MRGTNKRARGAHKRNGTGNVNLKRFKYEDKRTNQVIRILDTLRLEYENKLIQTGN